MADLATLGLRVENGQAVTALDKFSQASERAGRAGDGLTRITKAQEVELRRLAEISRSLGDVQGTQFKTLIQLNGGMERFLQIQKQIDAELVQADQIARQYEATQSKVAVATEKTGVGVRSLRSPLSQLSSQLLGLNPQVGQLAGLLGSFAVGSVVMAAALAGIAALAAIYDRLTRSSREAKEKVDALVRSLAAQRQASLDATEAGATAVVEQAKAAQKAAEEQARLNAARRSGRFGAGAAIDANLTSSAEEDERRIKEAKDAVRQAEINKQSVEIEGAKARFNAVNESYELEKSLAADRKRWADEDEAAAKKIAAAKTKAEKEYYREVEANRKFAQKQEEEWADKFKNILLERAGLIIEQREERKKFLGIEDVDIGGLAKKAADDIVRDFEKSKEDAKKYTEDMRAIWRRGIGRIVTDGTKSFRDFFEDALRLMGNLMARMDEQRRNGGKVNETLYKGLGIGSAAIGGAFSGYQIGQQSGDRFVGGLGGAFSGAASGAAIAGPLGAVFGGLAGLAGGLFGAADAADQAARQLKEMREAVKQNAEQLTLRATRMEGSLTAQINAVKRDYDNQRRSTIAANPDQAVFGLPKIGTDLAAEIARLNAEEAEYIESLKEEARIKNEQYKEDLQVRLLRAQGKEKEADALAQKQAQARELAALDEQIRLGLADKGTRALLLQVQAAELLKKTVDELTTAVKNTPRGFKIESYVNRFATAYQPSLPPVSIPYAPQAPQGMPPKITNIFQIGERAFLIDGNETPVEIVKKVKTGLQQVAATTTGPNVSLSEVWDYVGGVN